MRRMPTGPTLASAIAGVVGSPAPATSAGPVRLSANALADGLPAVGPGSSRGWNDGDDRSPSYPPSLQVWRYSQ